jgi:hypothetical protein
MKAKTRRRRRKKHETNNNDDVFYTQAKHLDDRLGRLQRIPPSFAMFFKPCARTSTYARSSSPSSNTFFFAFLLALLSFLPSLIFSE